MLMIALPVDLIYCGRSTKSITSTSYAKLGEVPMRKRRKSGRSRSTSEGRSIGRWGSRPERSSLFADW